MTAESRHLDVPFASAAWLAARGLEISWNRFVRDQAAAQRAAAHSITQRSPRHITDAQRGRIAAARPPWCAICGGVYRLSIDHIKSLAMGGSNDDDNLQLLCHLCNSRKGGFRTNEEMLAWWREHRSEEIVSRIKRYGPIAIGYDDLAEAVARTEQPGDVD
jgi:5-methylcytosine-specific restriction endonuclease McrA